MSIIYANISDHIDTLLKIAHENYSKNPTSYFSILSGLQDTIDINNGNVYQIVIEGFYRLKETNPTENYEIEFQNSLLQYISISKNVKAIMQSINYLFYQLKREKEGTAKFHINSEDIIQKINEKIHMNYEKYKKERPSFDIWLLQQKKYAKYQFGIDIG